MCILCALHRLSQLVPSMLPWLVIPLLGLWAVSQLLPPPLRFEITPPRLACGIFLIVVLFWYQILMPQLLMWQARRTARLQERRRNLALELQKLRKAAIRLCRNCLTPYRDQNPAGGKFMCCYCGHSSKRPVFELPGPPGTSGIIHDLIGKNGWICRQDWLALGRGKWARSLPRYLLSRKDNGDEHLKQKSSSTTTNFFTCKLLSFFYLAMRCLCRKVFGMSYSGGDGSSDVDSKSLSIKGANGASHQERKCEKARKKAEDKKLARLEKELLEEEERKQREEVARLIEEQRKLRDDKLQAVREHTRGLARDRGRDHRKESEKRRQERRKEKDKGSSKSNSDAEEVEKRVSSERERKCVFDRKAESEKQDYKKSVVESSRAHPSETSLGIKGGAYRSRYFDRMNNSLLPSSKGFVGAKTYSRGTQTSTLHATKPSKSITWPVEHAKSVNRGNICSSGNVVGQFNSNGDYKTVATACQRPVISDQPQPNAWKKSWRQLFTRTSVATSAPEDASSMTSPTQNEQMPHMCDHKTSSDHSPHNHIHFEQSFPFPMYPLPNGSIGSNLISVISPLPSESLSSCEGELMRKSDSEEAELFEDACNIPDPAVLLGPVSESLDNFPADLGCGFVAEVKVEGSRHLIDGSTVEMSKAASLDSPISPSKISGRKHKAPGEHPGIPKAQTSQGSHPNESSNANEPGTWQMWGDPLIQNPLDIIGASASWLSSVGETKSIPKDGKHPLVCSQASSDMIKGNSFSGDHTTLSKYTVNLQNGDSFTPLLTGLNEDAPWIEETVFSPLSGDAEKHFPPLGANDNAGQNEIANDNSSRSSTNWWSKDDWTTPDDGGGRNAILQRPHVGGLFPNDPHVQSVWSFS